MNADQTKAEKIFHSFISAVAASQKRPAGVLVSYELFNELNNRALIELKLATPGGIPALQEFGAIVPFFNGDIYVHCDPVNLPKDGEHFRLPPSAIGCNA